MALHVIAKNLETARLLEQASQELQVVRAERDLLAAQMEVVNIFRTALLGPAPARGAVLDMVWTMRKHAEELRTVPAEAATDD